MSQAEHAMVRVLALIMITAIFIAMGHWMWGRYVVAALLALVLLEMMDGYK